MSIDPFKFSLRGSSGNKGRGNPATPPVPPKPNVFKMLFGNNANTPNAIPKYVAAPTQQGTSAISPGGNSADPLNWRGIAAEQAERNTGGNSAGPVGGGNPDPHNWIGIKAEQDAQNAMFPDPRTNLNPLYDAATKRITEMNTGLQGNFDEAKAAILKKYAGSSSDGYDRYQNAKTNLDASAAGLGVQGDQIYKDYDPALRRIQENSDSQRNASTDLLDTLKVLRGQQGVDTLASLEQQKAKSLADQNALWIEAMRDIRANQDEAKAAKSGGSGGGGSGGGSGGSGSFSEKAVESSKSFDPGFFDEYNAMKLTNPEAADLMMEMYLGSQSSESVKSATAAIGLTAAEIAELEKPGKKPKTVPMPKGFFNKAFANKAAAGHIASLIAKEQKKKEAAARLKNQQLARQGLIRGASGSVGNASTTRTVTATGKD